jgi:two-component system sensor histidine kinase MtrB
VTVDPPSASRTDDGGRLRRVGHRRTGGTPLSHNGSRKEPGRATTIVRLGATGGWPRWRRLRERRSGGARRRDEDRPPRLARHHLGLRSRITAMFGLGALGLSVVMGVGTYLAARQFIIHQRESAAIHQTFADAELVARSDLAQPVGVLESLDASVSGSRSVLERRGQWYAASIPVGRTAVPEALRQLVAKGSAASQFIDLDGSPVLVVGVPIPSAQAEYFEIVSFADVERSLQILALALAGAGAVTTVAGAVVGRWASRRALDPLRNVSSAAEIIASGHLDTRLQATGDADLAPLAESFNHMADALEERIAREVRFTADVSHELRSPLTTLSTSVGVLEAHADGLSERGRTALRLLAAEVRHFQRMVTDLLDISRADSGSEVLSLDEVEVGELMAHLASSPTLAGTPVVVDPTVAGLHLRVDKRRIERVVANLVANASQYAGGATALRAEPAPAPPTRAPGTSWPATSPTPGDIRVRLVVVDAGPGIDPVERQRIFERFYRGSAAGRRGDAEGTGLGLALVAEHVRLHDGRVWAEPGPGGVGTRMVVELPALPSGPPTPDPDQPKSDPDQRAGRSA